MPRPKYTTLIGSLYLWIEDFDGLRMADQQVAVKDAVRALFRGHLAVECAGAPHLLVGLAIGQGAKDVLHPVNQAIPLCGLPVAQVKVVATTGRVPGIPCEVGFFEVTKYTRKWVVSINRDLAFWRKHLRLPPFAETAAGHLRATKKDAAQAMKKKIYLELLGGGIR